MSSQTHPKDDIPRYIPYGKRFIHAWQRIAELTSEENLSRYTYLDKLSRSTDRSPATISTFCLLTIFTILLINPDGIAPILSNVVSFIPVAQGHRRTPSITISDRLEQSLTKERSSELMDYWIVYSLMVLVETVLGATVISYLMPLWWAGKAAWSAHMLLSLYEDKKSKVHKPFPVALEQRRKSTTTVDTEAELGPEPEPESLEVQEAALSAGPPRAHTRANSEDGNEVLLSSRPVNYDKIGQSNPPTYGEPESTTLSGDTLVDPSSGALSTGNNDFNSDKLDLTHDSDPESDGDTSDLHGSSDKSTPSSSNETGLVFDPMTASSIHTGAEESFNSVYPEDDSADNDGGDPGNLPVSAITSTSMAASAHNGSEQSSKTIVPRVDQAGLLDIRSQPVGATNPDSGRSVIGIATGDVTRVTLEDLLALSDDGLNSASMSPTGAREPGVKELTTANAETVEPLRLGRAK